MKLSIITINYNNAKGLRKTLASVASQTFRDFEHIIVDGGSTDESVEIIREYADKLASPKLVCSINVRSGHSIGLTPFTPEGKDFNTTNYNSLPGRAGVGYQVTWISEPDKGIYNAMNKGTEIALGKRMVNPFNHSELVEDKNKGIKMAKGEYLLFLNSGDYFVDADTLKNVFEDANDVDIIYGDRINVYEDGSQKKVNCFPDKITGSFMYHSMISHQASFIKSDLL